MSDQRPIKIGTFSQPASSAFRGRHWGWEGDVVFICKNGANFLPGLIFFFCLLTGLWCRAQDTQPSEYQIKAAFLYNFAKFVEWPPETFPNPNAPMVIGVLGKNVFGDTLEKTLHNKTINTHPVELKVFSTVDEVTNCQVLFISSSEEERLAKTLAALPAANILTVSETDDFISTGGMINFVIEDNKIHFEVNNDAAVKAGLKISSKLLSLSIHKH